MARPSQIEFPGAIYHVMSRGNRKQASTPGSLSGPAKPVGGRRPTNLKPETGLDPAKPFVTPRSLLGLTPRSLLSPRSLLTPRSLLFVVAGSPTLNRKQGLTPRSLTPRSLSVWMADESQQGLELINRQARLPDDRPQGPFRHLVVIGDREASMRRIDLTEHNVATSLVVNAIADLLYRLDHIPARDAR